MRRYFDIPLHSYNSSYNSSCCVLCLSFFFLWRRGRGPTCTPSPLRTRVSRSLKVKSNKLTQPRWSTPPQDGFSPLRPTRTEAELEMLFREIRGAHHKRRFLHEALVAAWGSPPPPGEEPVGNFEGTAVRTGSWRLLMLREEGDLEDECNTTSRVWFRDANPHTHLPFPITRLESSSSLIVYVPANNTVAPLALTPSSPCRTLPSWTFPLSLSAPARKACRT